MKLTKSQLKQIIKEELELVEEREPAWWEDKEFPGGTTDADIEEMRARMREHWPEDIETLEWQDQVKLIPELVNKATGGHATIIRKFYRAQGGGGTTHFDELVDLHPTSKHPNAPHNRVPYLIKSIKDFAFKKSNNK